MLGRRDSSRTLVALPQVYQKVMVAWSNPACFVERKHTTPDSMLDLVRPELFSFYNREHPVNSVILKSYKLIGNNHNNERGQRNL